MRIYYIKQNLKLQIWLGYKIMHDFRMNRKYTFSKETNEIYLPVTLGSSRVFHRRFWLQCRKPPPIRSHFQTWLWYLTLNHYGFLNWWKMTVENRVLGSFECTFRPTLEFLICPQITASFFQVFKCLFANSYLVAC